MITIVVHYTDGRIQESEVPALDAAALAFMAIAEDCIERVEMVKFITK